MTLSENFHEAMPDYIIALAILCVVLVAYSIRIAIDKHKDSIHTEDSKCRGGRNS